MSFEDFNYALFNPYILVNENHDEPAIAFDKKSKLEERDLTEINDKNYAFSQIIEPFKA